MKRYFSYFLVFVFLFLLSIPVNAQESLNKSGEVIYEKDEIKDLNLLYKRAVKEINDVPVRDLNLPKYELKKNGVEVDLKINQYATTQLLKVKKVDNTKVEEIAVTTFAIVPENSLEGTVTASSSGNKYEEDWDDSYGVKAYSTIYYSRKVENNVNYAKLTSASGGWYVSDTSISLSGRKVAMGTSGWPEGSQTTTKYPSGNSWSYSAPSTWGYVSTDANHSVGATSTVTLKRGTSSTWTLKLNNNL